MNKKGVVSKETVVLRQWESLLLVRSFLGVRNGIRMGYLQCCTMSLA